MANSSLNVSSLDFDTLKSNFVTFLKSQPTFQDYNFEGSNINVLLDVMSYNTYLNSFYLNMIASEMFLDSAQKLDSVVSHAKELNYLPRSSRSAKSVISFTVDTKNIESPFIIPKGTIFNGSSNNGSGSYNFVTNDETSYLSSTSTFTVSNLEIYEGYYTNDLFIVDYTQENQQFILSNPNVDTNSIKINVSEDNGVTNTSYSYAETLYDLNSNSNVYFLQSSANQSYQVLFGDGVFGYKPINGSIVYANYRVSSGSDGNGITNINLGQDLGPVNGGIVFPPVITIDSISVGGANTESIESIRFNAPRYYQTQSRCVTSQDYVSTVLQNYPEIEYVNVFSGGLTNTSIEYGKVYISPSTYSGTTLTDYRKTDIQNFLNGLSPIGISVKVIDPDYMYITLTSLIRVNFKKTVSSPSVIVSNAITSIKNYNVNNLQNFNTAFRMSKFEQAINESDDGILSNETNAKIYRSYNPTLNLSIYAEYYNKIIKGSVYSTLFTADGKNYILTDFISGVDTGSGIIYLYEQNANLSVPNYIKVGTVDYINGIVAVSKLNFTNIASTITNSTLIRLYVTPELKDIYCKNNTIIEIDTISGINVSTVSEQ